MSVAPDGRRLLRVEARNAQTPIERKPAWIRTTARMGPEYRELTALVKREGLHTVCQEAGCPNIFECWEDREATFLIGGDECSRRCDFCQIHTGKPSRWTGTSPAGSPRACRRWACATPPSPASPATTSRTRAPGCTPRPSAQIHALNPGTGVEILVPDFSGKPELLQQVFDAAPEVFAHNLETVPRIFKRIRPGVPVRALAWTCSPRAARAGLVTKSNLILGHGRDPRGGLAGAARPARGRLRPGDHHPVPPALAAAPPGRALGEPEEFVELREEAEGSASPASCPGRWCARRTGPDGSGRRRCGGAARTCRRALAHLADAGTARQEAAGLLGA